MPDDSNKPRGQSHWERSFQHITQSLVVAGVLAVVGIMWAMKGQIGDAIGEIKIISYKITGVRDDVVDHENRIRVLERSERDRPGN